MVDIFNHLSSLLCPYFNAKVGMPREEWMDRLKTSNTVYVDNMSFYTAEEQVHFLFSQIGLVKKVIMGLNRLSFRPAGFCFVEYYQRQHAIDAVCFCNGATLDDMEIRCELDPGFQKGREFGYGLLGGQSVDDLRSKKISERPRGEGHVPLRNLAEYIRAKQQLGTHGREAEVLTADSLTEAAEGAEATKKQRPLAIVTERYRSELASSRSERPSASLHGRRRRAGDLSMTDRDDGMAAADSAAGDAGGGDEGERGQDDDAPAARGRRDRSRSASP